MTFPWVSVAIHPADHSFLLSIRTSGFSPFVIPGEWFLSFVIPGEWFLSFVIPGERSETRNPEPALIRDTWADALPGSRISASRFPG